MTLFAIDDFRNSGRPAGSEQALGDRRQPGQAPTVLVVDDDDLVRQMTVDLVEDAGFGTVEASDAQAALRILAESPDLQVMITDVRMPGQIDGYELARRTRERWPYVEIVVVSGYASPTLYDQTLDCVFLTKPYDGANLIRQVRAMSRRRF